VGIKVETPKVETPKVETPKVETPKVETPKVETPKVSAWSKPLVIAKEERCTTPVQVRRELECPPAPKKEVVLRVPKELALEAMRMAVEQGEKNIRVELL
jgi:hypothetical protein